MKKSGSQNSKSPSQLIDARIKELGDWRGEMLGRLRALVKDADPEGVEERHLGVHNPKVESGTRDLSSSEAPGAHA